MDDRILERLEREKRLMKIGMAVMAVVFVVATAVPQVHSIGLSIPLAASEFDLLGSGGKITAKLVTYRNGPNLIFYDNNGKMVEQVGIINDSALTSAGLNVQDNNAILAGNGVIRVGVGVTPKENNGEGLATFDGTGNMRSAFGQTLISGTVVPNATVYDPNGNVRSGVVYDPVVDFTGAFTDNAAGTSRASIGTGTDDINSFWQLNYSNGDIAVSGFTPPLTGNPPDVAVFDTTGAFRSVVGLEFFGAFNSSEQEIAHLP